MVCKTLILTILQIYVDSLHLHPTNFASCFIFNLPITEPTGPMFSGQTHQLACLNLSFSPPVGIPFSPLMDQSSLTVSHNDATGSHYEIEEMAANNKKIKCVQWNARGLTKSKLQEFNKFLSSTSPEIVFFSESHWSSSFNVRFRSYHILKKDRAQRMGGGVALLIHKSVQFLPLKCYSSNTVEAICATILTKNTGNIDVI